MPELKEITLQPSTIELVDRAFLDYVDKTLNISATTNQGWRKVPLIWVSAERSSQSKNNVYHDDTKTIILPAITIERTAVVKDPTRKGPAWAHIPPYNDEKGGSITVARRINQYTTSKFANADAARKWGSLKSEPNVGHGQLNFPRKNEKVVYETITMPMPTYINVTYQLKIETEYQQQMNEILTPFVTKTGQINNFIMRIDGHMFEGFMPQDFTLNNNVSNLGENERKFETSIDIRVLAYLMGEDKNSDYPKITIRENPVELVIVRESVVFGDIPDHMPIDRIAKKDT